MTAFILALMISATSGIPLFQFDSKETCEAVKSMMIEDTKQIIQCVQVKIKDA